MTDKKMREEIEKALREKGQDWVVAAMVEGSIGYHSPGGARRCILNYQAGQREDWCERCMACFRCDLEAMILHDIRYFTGIEERDPCCAARIVRWCQAVEKMSREEQTTAGLMYPSTSI